MDQEQKRALVNQLFIKLTATFAEMGITNPSVSVIEKDTDLDPLQPVLGDYLLISVAAVVRIKDIRPTAAE